MFLGYAENLNIDFRCRQMLIKQRLRALEVLLRDSRNLSSCLIWQALRVSSGDPFGLLGRGECSSQHAVACGYHDELSSGTFKSELPHSSEPSPFALLDLRRTYTAP